MPRGWVYWKKRDRDDDSHASMSWADGVWAARLRAQAEHAEQAAMRAMARSDWSAAAELEEERVARQDELAQLLMSQRAPTSE